MTADHFSGKFQSVPCRQIIIIFWWWESNGKVIMTILSEWVPSGHKWSLFRKTIWYLHWEHLPHQCNFIPTNTKHDIKMCQFSKCDNLLLYCKEQETIVWFLFWYPYEVIAGHLGLYGSNPRLCFEIHCRI